VAILIGTDFNKGVKGAGPKKGVELIRRCNSIENLRAQLRERISKDYEEVRKVLLNPPTTDEYKLQYLGIQEKGLYDFLCNERSFSKQSVDTAIQRMKRFYSSLRQSNLGKWTGA
jgi:flap endonuclease-1